jgi:hypothetical protein
MARPPNYQLYPLLLGARCANCKNLKELHEGYACVRFEVRVKAEGTCDDWEASVDARGGP